MPGSVFQTGSSSTDSTGIDLSYSYQILGGVGSTGQNLKVQDGDQSRHAERCASNVHSAGSSRSLTRAFTRCNWIEGPSAKRAQEGAER